MRKMLAAVTVRPFRPEDDEFVLALSERAFAPWSAHPGASVVAMIERAGARTLVAESRTRSLGFAIVGLVRHARDYGPWQKPLLASLDAIAVTPEAQGRRLGRLLLGHAMDLAREAGAIAMSLNTARTNARARRLFESAGFQTLVTLRGFYASGQSALHMIRTL